MPNRLADETSPYLLQHADNPVDWHPWGEPALGMARRTDRPILLSIGYSACHWCHVMAHESFEDPDVAEVMNRLFVNIKVDREERPDLDLIYQQAHHMLSGRSGGWPLTVFLTPDGAPFYSGTYFPRSPRYGLPGFADLLERVADAYREKRDDIAAQNRQLLDILAQAEQHLLAETAETLSDAPILGLRQMLDASFDPAHGGFGGAPKFPHPSDLRFLFGRGLGGDDRARAMVLATLDHMADGGIYDHIGGGFCRYSVDARWDIPHFEKMLYDNGPLLGLYAEAAVLTGEPRYRQVAEETAAWVMREMEAPYGGYYSSIDADSEGEEGRFYLWQRDEVRRLLDTSEYAVLSQCYGLDGPPNFEGNAWHLRIVKSLDDVAASLGLSAVQGAQLLASARDKLFAVRRLRVPPARDDKILTAWNALMIEAMARAGVLLGRPQWVASARRALDALRATLWQDGRLLATAREGRAHLNAYLDDHAFLLAALIGMLQADFRAADLDWAIALADRLLEQFEDAAAGGFYFTSHDHEALIARPKPAHDNATPSGNAIAAEALQRLGHLLGDERYLAAAERCLRVFHAGASGAPAGFAAYAMALETCRNPPTHIILRGPPNDVAAWRDRLVRRLDPGLLVLPLANHADPLPDSLVRPVSDVVNAWVCSGVTCLPPVSDWSVLERIGKPGHIG